eukprot:3749695-Rhodomonas_salina.2
MFTLASRTSFSTSTSKLTHNRSVWGCFTRSVALSPERVICVAVINGYAPAIPFCRCRPSLCSPGSDSDTGERAHEQPDA